jgi:hypothetical protein
MRRKIRDTGDTEEIGPTFVTLFLFPSGMVFFCDSMSVFFDPSLHTLYSRRSSYILRGSVHEKGV